MRASGIVLGGLLAGVAAGWSAATEAAPPPAGVPPELVSEVPRGWTGPDHVTVDLLRPGGDEMMRKRIYVQAILPDGEPALFLVDTGAAISAISEDTAERLGLDVLREYSWLEGLSGRTPFHRAVVPSMKLGEATLTDVEVAVGVNGVPTSAGWMPLDGILGNNVWSQFVVEIDYPADTLVLHRPGTFKMPRKAAPMYFDGSRVLTGITIVTETDPPRSGEMIIQLDTGASELLLSGSNALPFEGGAAVWSEGVEPVFGIGAADIMPTSTFFRRTRRFPVDQVGLGGRTVDVDFDARWLNYEQGPFVGPSDLPGLAGHELMEDYVAIFDYRGGEFALKKSRRKARAVDGHLVLLEQDMARYGDDPTRYLFRAKMKAALEEYEEADALLERFLAQHPDADDAGEARVLLAAVRRHEGDLDGAWKALGPMTPADMVDQGEIVATVNGLLLEGRAEDALTLAESAIEEYGPEAQGDDWEPAAEAYAHAARADALLSLRRYDEANDSLLEAAKLLENPDAQLLRRARVALASGDRYGAMADMRRLLQLYPSNGQYLWFYATLIRDEADEATFRLDMADAMARLHKRDRPLDYMVHAHHLLGEQDRAVELMREGLERDCDEIEEEPSRDNCYAWYYAMAGVHLDDALKRIDGALAAEGDRSDFLDTRAMVHLARGEYVDAQRYSLAAARMAPDEIYMLWQAERIGDIAATMAATSDGDGASR